MKRKLLLGILLILFVLTQLQLVILHSLGAVDGSFGLRPMTHQCLGLKISGETVARVFPAAEAGTRLGNFSVRYAVGPEAGERTYCLGQDIWFGE